MSPVPVKLQAASRGTHDEDFHLLDQLVVHAGIGHRVGKQVDMSQGGLSVGDVNGGRFQVTHQVPSREERVLLLPLAELPRLHTFLATLLHRFLACEKQIGQRKSQHSHGLPETALVIRPDFLQQRQRKGCHEIQAQRHEGDSGELILTSWNREVQHRRIDRGV